MDIVRKYRALEDHEVRAATKRYYGPILRISNVFPYIDDGWLAITIIHSFLIMIGAISYACLLAVSTYLLKDDFLLSGVEFHYFLLVVLTAILSVYAIYKRGTICRLHKYMYNLYDYGVIDTSDEVKKELQQIIKNQRLWLIPVLVLVGITAAFMSALGPLIDGLVGAGETRSFVNDVYMKSPVPLYFPFKIESAMMHYVASSFPIVITILITPTLGGVILMYIVDCQFLAHEHRLLILSIKNLSKRSAKVHKRRYRDQNIEWANICDDNKFQSCITFCMKQNMQHHQRMREYYNDFTELAGFPVLLSFIVATFVLALALFTFIEKTNRIGLLLTSMLSMIVELMVIFTICFFGEEILALGEEVNETIYGIEWYNLSMKNKKMLISMQDCTRHPFAIKAYLVFDCNMDSFSSICNSAYSYFNMLSASSAAKSS